MNELRKQVARMARRLYDGEITFDEFLAVAPEQGQDELIDELVDLIEHEPRKGGLLGLKRTDHENYVKAIFEVIERLENNKA